MWSSNQAHHDACAKVIREIAATDDMAQRHKMALDNIYTSSINSPLNSEKRAEWMGVVAAAAIAPLLFRPRSDNAA